MKLNDVAQFLQGKKLLNPQVISKLQQRTGEILPGEWLVAIMYKRDNNSGAVQLQKGMYKCGSTACTKTGTDLSRPMIQCIQNIIHKS
jgi:hypothetical protein